MSKSLNSSNRARPLSYGLGLVGVLVLVAIVLWLFQGPSLTPESLAQIKMGMTPQQVVQLVGKPAEQKVQGALNLTGTTYTYHHGPNQIQFIFLNDRLVAKEGQY